MRRLAIPLLVTSSALALLAGGAQAAAADQAPAATPASPEATTATVGEVIVTARRRAESLEKVPVAVDVVKGSEATAKNLNDIQDITSMVPSVDFRTSASNKDRTIFIRGVGTISTSPGVEPSVSTVVDGVVYARAGQATADFSDVDHVEVLEGPQGTLFGKNATAGVINIVTRNPTNVLSGYADAGYYTGGEYRLDGGISGPLAKNVQALLSVFDGGFKGNVFDNYDQKYVNGYEHWGARTKIIADLTDNLTLTLGADYTHEHDTTPNGVWLSNSQQSYPLGTVSTNVALGAAIAAGGVTPGPDNTHVSTNLTSNVTDVNSGVSATLDWKLPHGLTLTSITAYRFWNNDQYQDFDGVSQIAPGVAQINDAGHLRFHQISQEIRLSSPKDQFIDYVVGLYFMNEIDHETYGRADSQLVSGAPFNSSGLADYGTNDRNYAVFGEGDVNFTKKFRLILGGRVIHDDLSFYQNRVDAPTASPGSPGIAPNFTGNGSVGRTGWAGRTGLQYDITPDMNVYGTVSRGYMGPAYNVFFNMSAVNTPPLNPETSTSYEVGLKSRWLNDHVQANLAAYITNFQNYQANFLQLVNGAQVTNLVNAGTVTSRGAEANVIAKLWEGFTVSGDVGYDDAYVVSFPCPANASISCNINGKPLPFAPRWKSHFDADYQAPMTSRLTLDLDTDWEWQSKTQFQLTETPDTVQPAYGIWNASFGLLDLQGGWSAHFVVKNILNTHYSAYLAHGNLGGLVTWIPRDFDRYVGVNVHKDF
ncbi:MAG: TonB-dependent receptor [Alphaproteobacteria bacterium]|nr:TonB-dependent receptor [Alphaproteobacteria bacterium]